MSNIKAIKLFENSVCVCIPFIHLLPIAVLLLCPFQQVHRPCSCWQASYYWFCNELLPWVPAGRDILVPRGDVSTWRYVHLVYLWYQICDIFQSVGNDLLVQCTSRSLYWKALWNRNTQPFAWCFYIHILNESWNYISAAHSTNSFCTR